MGFSLFGKSGNTSTTQQTSNVTNDVSIVDSYKNTFAPVLNAALTKNSSFINNDTRIQNTSLQLTDAFNTFSTKNLANVGNVSIGSGTSADDASQYVDLFKAFQGNPRGLNDAVPNLDKSLLDFTALSQIATDNIYASGSVAKSIQDGFAKNTLATGSNLAGEGTSTGLLSLGKWALVAGVGLVLVWLLVRRKSS